MADHSQKTQLRSQIRFAEDQIAEGKAMLANATRAYRDAVLLPAMRKRIGWCYRRVSEAGETTPHFIYTRILGISPERGYRLLDIQVWPDWRVEVATIDIWPEQAPELGAAYERIQPAGFLGAVAPLLQSLVDLVCRSTFEPAGDGTKVDVRR